VDFAFLSAEEIRTLSVKQIQNPTTFDTLLNPVPGGLYDPALGAWGDIQSVYGRKSAYLKLFH
jgi:DNA-directed RNA polymerase I subunit RPA1